MVRHFKQFGASVTSSKRNSLLNTRFGMTAAFTVVTMIIALSVGASANILRTERFKYLREYLDSLSAEQAISLLRGSVVPDMMAIVTATVILSATVWYFLSRVIVRQIELPREHQRRFIHDASHELRTPLSIMKARAELALAEGGKLTNKDAIDTLNDNLYEIDRMTRMIKHLLVMANRDTNVEALRFTKVNFNKIVTNVVAETSLETTGATVPVTIAHNDPISPLWGNENALREMIIQILKNARTHTAPPGGAIDVHIIKTKTGLTFLVKDNGIGIPLNDLRNVFKPFYKGKNSLVGNKKGPGLGLALVEKTAKDHGGEVTIESAEGFGTVVAVSIKIDSEENTEHARPLYAAHQKNTTLRQEGILEESTA